MLLTCFPLPYGNYGFIQGVRSSLVGIVINRTSCVFGQLFDLRARGLTKGDRVNNNAFGDDLKSFGAMFTIQTRIIKPTLSSLEVVITSVS